MRTARNWRAENWADFLPRTLGLSSPPIDLYSVARLKHITHLGFRLMVPRGLLLPVEGGFKVYIRDTRQKRDIDISKEDVREPVGFLSPRQRFSLAHEIAHTLFYKMSESVPAPDGILPITPDLEQICDRTAANILIPTHLLKKEITDSAKIDAMFIQSIATKFRTSVAVAMSRLAIVESSNPFERCVLLVRRIDGDAEIRASYFGVGLLPTLPRPNIYTRITEWLTEFPRREIDNHERSEWQTIRKGKHIKFTKIELSGHREFLLEAQVVTPSKAASSFEG
jgi:hypothetical protein